VGSGQTLVVVVKDPPSGRIKKKPRLRGEHHTKGFGKSGAEEGGGLVNRRGGGLGVSWGWVPALTQILGGIPGDDSGKLSPPFGVFCLTNDP